MSDQPKYAFDRAKKVADYIASLLMPHCTRLHIAGSLRRFRPEIKDIEIICEPKREFVQNGLFPDTGDWLIVKDFTEALATITDIVMKGNVEGRYMQIKTTSKICPGIYLDLFMPQKDDYFRQYAIRTGSSEYSHHIIAGAWFRKGWVGTKDGLRLKEECIHKNNTWECVIEDPTRPPVWSSEGDFFIWLGLEYIDPEHREYHQTINISQ